jgi:hypothetical protein
MLGMIVDLWLERCWGVWATCPQTGRGSTLAHCRVIIGFRATCMHLGHSVVPWRLSHGQDCIVTHMLCLRRPLPARGTVP